MKHLNHEKFNRFNFWFLTLFLMNCSLGFHKEIKISKTIPSICFDSLSDLDYFAPKDNLSSEDYNKLKKHLSSRAISIASDLSVEKDIIQFLVNKDISEKQKISKKIHDRIHLSYMELSSMLAIADCERDRAIQFASHLDMVSAKNINDLSIKSLLSTVMGTTFAASFELAGLTNQAYLGVDVFFAFLSGYFALQAFNLSTVGDYRHEKNLLREIKENPENSKYFYNSVWNFLTNKNYPGELPEREEIINIWYKDGMKDEDENLLFSEGGSYNAIQVYKRVHMLDTLKTRMSYMKLELRLLTEELNQLEKNF
ncbi:MAG: hypothetical protein H7A24_17510 [Leptospiraceae bacterium]|nr:hypothetical protein [Leptospiraceae bacterium]MCP5513691.1 hypothetical protein [Leptospiraceae bacterium]